MDLMNYVPKRPENILEHLSEGRHDVVISRVAIINDRMKNWSGLMKTAEELKASGVDWADSHEQLGVTFSKAGSGMVTTRLNTVGFVRYADLSETDGFFASTGDEGYAIDEKTNERVISKKNQAIALDIMNQLFANAETLNEDGEWKPLCEFDEDGNPTSEVGIEDLLKCRVSIEVIDKKYKGKGVPPDVINYRKYGHGSNINLRVEATADAEVATSETGQDDKNF